MIEEFVNTNTISHIRQAAWLVGALHCKDSCLREANRRYFEKNSFNERLGSWLWAFRTEVIWTYNISSIVVICINFTHQTCLINCL